MPTNVDDDSKPIAAAAGVSNGAEGGIKVGVFVCSVHASVEISFWCIDDVDNVLMQGLY